LQSYSSPEKNVIMDVSMPHPLITLYQKRERGMSGLVIYLIVIRII